MSTFLHSPSQIINPLARQRRFGFGGGLGGGEPAFVGALDAYTTNLDVAWSVARRLLTSYTGSLIRVRRSSDNTEQDIGYAADGSLDTAALLSFTGAGNGFLTKIYAQTGSKNLVNGTAASQPRIVNAGSVITVGSNSRPAGEVVTDNTQSMATASFTALTSSSMTVAAFVRATTYATAKRLIGGCQIGQNDSGTLGWLPAYIATPGLRSYDSGDKASLTLTYPKNQAYAGTTTTGSHILRTSATSNTNSFTTGGKNIEQWLLWTFNGSISQCHAGDKFAEAAIWTANRDSDMTTYLTALETYFGS